MSASRLLETGRRVLRLEADAIRSIERSLGDAFARAVEMLRDCDGRVIVTGIGKSGLIARKIAATLTSTGTPASWLHPVDCLHGDLGARGDHDEHRGDGAGDGVDGEHGGIPAQATRGEGGPKAIAGCWPRRRPVPQAGGHWAARSST